MTFPRLSEDPRYGFAIGRVRALEPLLLDRPRYDRFARAKNGDDFLAALAESAYGRFIEGGAGGITQAFDRAASDNFAFFAAYALDDWLLRLFSVATAFHRLKVSIKNALAQGTNEVTVPGELAVPPAESVSRAVADAFAASAASRNPAAADMALDRSMQQVQLQIAKASDFLSGYFGLHADIENLRTLARLKANDGPGRDTRGEMAAAFLEGGTLTHASLVSALAQPWDAALDLLAKAPPYGAGSDEFRDYLEQGRSAATDRRSFVRMERLGREQELRYLRQARFATFGHEPLIAFFLLRENELRNLRLLHAAKLGGLADEATQELVAYVE